ncbi:MAG: DUF1211 domain-containing protein [Akkermansiaceae bacterium]|nr:DUF1211 domain-containing protein [Armatimonadota bacterium]
MTTDRVNAFSDGVFAIAITLLVLDIKSPSAWRITSDAELAQSIGALWPRFAAYVQSFLVIGVYWVAHHTLLRLLRQVDRAFLWLNNLFLLCVAFIPFPASLLGTFTGFRTSSLVYGTTLVVTGMALYIAWRYASRGNRLLAPDFPAQHRRAITKRILIAPLLYIAAMLVSFVQPRLCIVLYALVPLGYILPWYGDRLPATGTGAKPNVGGATE